MSEKGTRVFFSAWPSSFLYYLLSQITKRGLFFQDNYYIKQLVKSQITTEKDDKADVSIPALALRQSSSL